MDKRIQRMLMKTARITKIAANAHKVAMEVSPLVAGPYMASAFAAESHVPWKVLRADKPEIDKRRARRHQRRMYGTGKNWLASANKELERNY